MSQPIDHQESLPTGLAGRINPVCDQFEAAWRAGERPRLEDFLPQVDSADRAALLRELLALELYYRSRQGEQRAAEEYRLRFPEHAAVMDAVFGGLATPRSEASSSRATAGTVPETGACEAAPTVQVPGYEVLHELGRGGMGVVYQARHVALDRVVALKMILAGGHAGQAELARFRTEAEAVARLQHPNIVQIFEVGEHGGLPFFSLEFCGGSSLDKKLNGTPIPPKEAAALVETLARAMQAAHDKGVIHRDLKPANVLLAEDGTPKVTDFGLARKLDAAGQTQSGAIMGTPSYMAPEQAGGKSKEIGPACDVYALGAILYECLTGRPPFKAATPLDTILQVVADDPVPPRQLLSKTPRDLETICLKCLQKEPAKRYKSAAELAEDLRRFQAGEPIRARPVGGIERAWRWRKRHPSRAGLAAAVMLVVAGAGAGAVWYQQVCAARAAEKAGLAAEHARKAANTERDVAGPLEEATAFVKQAAGLHDDPTRWEAALVEARSAVMRADGVLNSGVDDTGALRPRVDAVQTELAAAERDRLMIARLEEARLQKSAAGMDSGFDATGAAALYAAAFQQDDADWASLAPREAADRINRRAVREEMLAALEDWVQITPKNEERATLGAILRAADPDPNSLRNRWDAALAASAWDVLQRLAADPEAMNQPPAMAANMGVQLRQAGHAAEALHFLQEAEQRHPGDFWLAFEVAYTCLELKPAAADEAIRYYSVALALRPRSAATHNNLGVAFHFKGRIDEAIAEYRQAVQLKPDFAEAHHNLGKNLTEKGRTDEAAAECRMAIAIQPDFAEAHSDLGAALCAQGRPDEAVAEFRKAIELKPDYPEAHTNLGIAFREQHRPDEALAEFRKAVALAPDLAAAQSNLGAILREQGMGESLAAFRRAVERNPDLAEAHANLGEALRQNQRVDEAAAEFRRAIELKPDLAQPHNGLGATLFLKGKVDESILECRKAVGLQPDYGEAHANLGNALAEKGQLDEAITECRLGVKLNPNLAGSRSNLGRALYLKGQLDEAMGEFRKAIELEPDLPQAHYNLGLALHAKHQLNDAMAEYRKAIDLKPDYAEAHDNLGNAHSEKGQLDDALAEHRKAVEVNPDYAVGHYNLGVALQNKGRLDEAMTEFRKAIELKPNLAQAHINLGNALFVKGRLDEAAAEFRKAVEAKPDDAAAHCNLGLVLGSGGRPEQAVVEFRKAIELKPDLVEAHSNLAFALYSTGRFDEAVTEYRKAIEMKPDEVNAHGILGDVLRAQGRPDEAVAEYRKVLELRPDFLYAYGQLAYALREGGHFSESLVAFRRWQQLRAKTLFVDLEAPGCVQTGEQLVALDAMLPTLLKGDAAPANAVVSLRAAEVCRDKGLDGAAARYAEEAFRDEPDLADQLADNQSVTQRYHAAQAAALAGCGEGRDAAQVDEKERAHWRQQGQSWLRIELAQRAKKMDSGDPSATAKQAQVLRPWREDPELAGVRDADALAKLPVDEQNAWRKLWADVQALLDKADAKK